jgi:pilus assembly protein Flp/PilA
MKKTIKRFISDDTGQDLIEYALLAGLISIVCVIAITNAGTKVSGLYDKVQSSIP